MTNLAPSASAMHAPAAIDGVRPADERLPIGQSALIIAALSLGLWAGIAMLVRWPIG